ncbi:asparagine synthase (glutamine-hydrolyzing) [Fictibacillus sp. 5RED26]|uniref:asparagine synthase (glutamine-hydrolyzing) n=1 Tax=Fictibacillus sp. 5RED26 TaxID=2745876 RepID=UPI0018CFEAF5|nr:asparagine synthase (glutamine-hydrolyzing) [Fictibacillus sp. 5RED26]MBH0158610.1 asparagine synthase (glutamine-hydrolyzing) [Fictibacillus sp. 5RED26]
MCGFISVFSHSPLNTFEQNIEVFKEMTNIISHRGPDDTGYYIDNHVLIGFRRLSIIDIESGKQPFGYEDDRYWMVFNGEIYNFFEIRKQLQALGYTFQTESDTEVLIALYSYKREQALDDLRGMYSFVIWDKKEQELFGARDHFGIKPFFYLDDHDHFYCASEKKSILLASDGGKLDHESVHHYLTFQFVPEPHTLSEKIKRLEPGHYFKKKIGQKLEINSYWKPHFKPRLQDLNTSIEEIRNVLRESVGFHMRSDVPVGAFLSGGIDSSSIVALAKEHHDALKTFTVGFEREGFSEINVAKTTAAELNVENIHYVIQPEEFLQELPKIIWHLDEPVADPAAVPLYFLAREARKHVTVVLSGEGADELFGGYTIYNEPRSLRYFRSLPPTFRKVLPRIASVLPHAMKGKSFLERGAMDIEERYIGNAKIFLENEKEKILNDYNQEWSFKNVTKSIYENSQHYDDVHKMQYIDMHTWLRGDILVKADKMTMAHSLELRVPFLDKEVFNVASRLHPSQTVTAKTTKYALRKAMEGIVPNSVLYNRKLGFPVPIRHWLRNEWLVWATELIEQSETDYLFNKSIVLNLLQEHQEGLRDNSRKLWTILTFMIWHQIFVEDKYTFQTTALETDKPVFYT